MALMMPTRARPARVAWPKPAAVQVLVTQQGEIDVQLRVVHLGLDAELT
jgi:hypothetical protein